MSERPYTVKEVAVYLSVSEFTVRSYIRNGALKAQKIGVRSKKSKVDARPVRIYEKDLIEFMNTSSNLVGEQDEI